MSGERIGQIGGFVTARGFFYRGKLLSESETHYTIFDIKTGQEMELLKASIERIAWEKVE